MKENIKGRLIRSDKYFFLGNVYLFLAYSFFMFFVILSKLEIDGIHFIHLLRGVYLTKLLEGVKLQFGNGIEKFLVFAFHALLNKILSKVLRYLYWMFIMKDVIFVRPLETLFFRMELWKEYGSIPTFNEIAEPFSVLILWYSCYFQLFHKLWRIHEFFDRNPVNMEYIE